MNNASKVELQALGVTDREKTIILTRKVIAKHNNLKNVQNKSNALLNKIKNFKAKFALPSFWDARYFLISQKDYQALFV